MNCVLYVWLVRFCYWFNVYVMVCLIGSGWGIYNVLLLLDFCFFVWVIFGGWFGGFIVWYFVVMWLLFGNGLCYFVYGLFSGYFCCDFLFLSVVGVWCDLCFVFGLCLVYELGCYNVVQCLLYWLVLGFGVLLVLFGLVIWKLV